MSTHGTETSYRHPLVGYGYDLLSRLVFAPVGGLAALRDEALAAFGLEAGMHVLELGCGTGALTQRLLARGLDVTAVDQSEVMLRLARGRAPAATFAQAEITQYRPGRRYQRVLFSFVLHELDAASRGQALSLARECLTPDGAVAIIDHALPPAGLIPRAMSAFVHAFEPPSIVDWLRDGFDAELAAARLVPVVKQPLARGTAIAMLCHDRSPEPQRARA